MDKDKSIIEKFTDTVKEMANSASEALKADQPPKVEQTNAAYMPFAAAGLVSDPLLVPPVAVVQPRRKRAVKKSSARKATAKRAVPKKARKPAKTARRKPKARGAAKASAKRTTKGATKRKSAKRPTRRGQR